MSGPNEEWRMLLAATGAGVAKYFHRVLGGRESKYSFWQKVCRGAMSVSISVFAGFALAYFCMMVGWPHLDPNDLQGFANKLIFIAGFGAWGGDKTLDWLTKKLKKEHDN